MFTNLVFTSFLSTKFFLASKFSLPKATKVRLLVYNVIGKQVAELINQNMSVGNHNITFDASALSSGIYYYKLISGEFISTKKMLLLK